MTQLLQRRFLQLIGGVLLALPAAPAMAQPFSIDWYTIDGGGAMATTGGTYELSGSIGQHDAGPTTGPMTGGSFSLVGGFWPGASAICALPGDINGDGRVNGLDVQLFANCILNVGALNCGCADFDASGNTTIADVSLFVSTLLGS